MLTSQPLSPILQPCLKQNDNLTSLRHAVWLIPNLRQEIISYLTPKQAHPLLLVDKATFEDAVKLIYRNVKVSVFNDNDQGPGSAPHDRLKLYQRAVRSLDVPLNYLRRPSSPTLLPLLIETYPFTRIINSSPFIQIISPPLTTPVCVEIKDKVWFETVPNTFDQDWDHFFSAPDRCSPCLIPKDWKLCRRSIVDMAFAERPEESEFPLRWGCNSLNGIYENQKLRMNVNTARIRVHRPLQSIIDWFATAPQYLSEIQKLSVVCNNYTSNDLTRLANLTPKLSSLSLRHTYDLTFSETHPVSSYPSFLELDFTIFEHMNCLELEIHACCLNVPFACTLRLLEKSLETFSLVIRPSMMPQCLQENQDCSLRAGILGPVDLAIILLNIGGIDCDYSLTVMTSKPYTEEFIQWAKYRELVLEGIGDLVRSLK